MDHVLTSKAKASVLSEVGVLSVVSVNEKQTQTIICNHVAFSLCACVHEKQQMVCSMRKKANLGQKDSIQIMFVSNEPSE